MLKKKITAFKPKARPRPNANSSQTPSSANASVERQTQTPAPLSQEPQSTGPNAEPRSEAVPVEEVPTGPELSHAHPPASAETRETQSISQQETTSEPPLIPVSDNRPGPVASSSIPTNPTEIATPLPSEPSIPDKTRPVPENTSTTPASAELSSATATAPLVLTQTPNTTSAQIASPSSHVDAATGSLTTHSGSGSGRPSQEVPAASSGDNTTSTRSAVSSRTVGSDEGRPAKRRKVASNSREDVRPTIEDEGSQAEAPAPAKPKRRRKPKDPNAPKRKRKRASTPEDAETQVVDKSTTKMSDLTKDLHIGRNFSMRDTILSRELERKEKARIAKEKESLEAASDGEGEGGQNEENIENDENRAPGEATGTSNETASVPVVSSSGPRLRLVNGVIQLDETSLQVDRHRAAAEGAEEMAVVEEDDFTRIVTSGTNQKKEKGTRWGHHDTEKFYEGLKMFGTDFEMIAKTFGKKRSRRQIKLKYNKEEIENPDRIHRCITGKEKQAMDLSKLKGGSKYTDTDVIKAEIAALEKAYEDEENRQAEELAEADRRKKATIAAGGRASGGGTGGTESSKENEATSGKAGAAHKTQKKAPVKKSKRAQVQHMGGEDYEIVGHI